MGKKTSLTAAGILSILISLNAVSAFASEQILTLQDIIQQSLSKNPAVIEAEKRWEEKQRRIPGARALPNPKFGIMKDDIPNNTFNPFNGMMTEYSLSQEFMNPGKLRVMGKMAENDAAMSQFEYDEKKLEVYVQAKQAYYDYLYIRNALKVMRDNQLLMNQLIDLAQVNYTTGMVAMQDTLKAQTEYTRMNAEIISMEAMEKAAYARLNTVMGRPTGESFTVGEEFHSAAPDYDADNLLAIGAKIKPALVAMQSQLAMAQNGVELAKRQSNPDFELRVGYKTYKAGTSMVDDGMGGTSEVITKQPGAWRVELMAMLPVWAGKNQSDVQSAAAGVEAVQASIDNMKNMQAMDIQMALADANSAWRQADLYRTTVVPQAEQTYQAALVGYTAGKVDMMTVLEGINTMRNAQLGLYKTKVDYEKAVAGLEKAVGKTLSGPEALTEKTK